MNGVAQSIQQDGYAVIRNVLSSYEIGRLRGVLTEYFKHHGEPFAGGITQPNAAIEVPALAWIFYHDKILKLVRQALTDSEIVFTSHCDIHSRILGNWHKDDGTDQTSDGYFERHVYEEDACRVYKVAIYLQDHRLNRAGLTVRRGSHRTASLDTGEETYLATRPGDVIIFDVRLTHKGQQEVVPIPYLSIPASLAQKTLNQIARKLNLYDINRMLIKRSYDQLAGPKQSIFFTFGAANEFTQTFALNNMRRQLRQTAHTETCLPAILREKLSAHEILLAEDKFPRTFTSPS